MAIGALPYDHGTVKVVYLLTFSSIGANEINHWVNSNPSFADWPKLCCHILLQQFIQADSFILLRSKFEKCNLIYTNMLSDKRIH